MCRLYLSLAIVMISAAPLRADEPEGAIQLENDVLELLIYRAPTPHIGRLIHKPTGTTIVSDPKSRDLFELVVEGADGQQKSVAASAAQQSSCTVSDDGGERVAVMQWSGFSEVDVTVQVTARCAAVKPLTLWSIELDYRSSQRSDNRITLVRFPRVMTLPQIGRPEDDFLVLPALPGVRIDNPAGCWPEGQTVMLSYPGELSAQFLTWQDRTAGVYFAGQDSQNHSMTLGVAKRAAGFQLWHECALPSSVGKGTWELSYPIAIGVTQGTWQESADLYKQWAVEQPWCSKTLSQRDDIPAWWKAGPAVHVCGVRTYDSQYRCSGSYYPRLVDHMTAFQEKIDGPVVAMLASWEQHRRWTAGDYFPIFDQPNAQPVIRQLGQKGIRPFFFLSGLYYTFENEGVDPSTIPTAADYRKHYVVDQQSGEPRVFVLDESGSARQWKRNSYEFCVSDPATTDFFCRVVDQAHELGVDVLQMDQTTSGGGHACYAKDHPHQPGTGDYQTQGFYDLMQTVRNHGKAKTSDFVLFHEEPHEQLIQCTDGFHVREYKEKWWYRQREGSVGIPLFDYLYHEYAIGYGGDSAGLHPSNSRQMVRSHAVNLVTGRTPGAAIWASHENMSNAHPDQIAMLRNHSRLLKTRARDFLMLGKMLHSLELDVPTLTFRWSTGSGNNTGSATTQDPVILTSSWQSPSGSVGHLFVNISEERQTLNVELDTRNAQSWPASDVSLCSSSSDMRWQPLWVRTSLPRSLSQDMQPLEALFVEVSPAAE